MSRGFSNCEQGLTELDLDDHERAALYRELEASIAETEAGKLIDADEVLAELRAMR